MRRIALATTFLTALAGAALAQSPTPSVPGPYNIDLGKVLGITNTNSAVGGSGSTTVSTPTGSTYTTTPLNLAYNGIVCDLQVTGESSSPSIAWSIQQYDAASNSYLTLLTQTLSATQVANMLNGTLQNPQLFEVRPGIQTTSLPTGMSSINLALPRVWRVQVTNYAAQSGLTGQVSCNLMK